VGSGGWRDTNEGRTLPEVISPERHPEPTSSGWRRCGDGTSLETEDEGPAVLPDGADRPLSVHMTQSEKPVNDLKHLVHDIVGSFTPIL
jgi:hypothetical protein